MYLWVVGQYKPTNARTSQIKRRTRRNISDGMDLQTLQNHALRICFNVRLRDRMSVKLMHNRANSLSLEQRRQKQMLCLMFIFKERHDDVHRLFNHRTSAAAIYIYVNICKRKV